MPTSMLARGIVFFQETAQSARNAKNFFVPCLNKNEQFHIDLHGYVKPVVSQ